MMIKCLQKFKLIEIVKTEQCSSIRACMPKKFCIIFNMAEARPVSTLIKNEFDFNATDDRNVSNFPYHKNVGLLMFLPRSVVQILHLQ